MGKNKNLFLGILFVGFCAYFLFPRVVKKTCAEETLIVTVEEPAIIPAPILHDVYLGELGVKEYGCDNCGERVEWYLSKAGLGKGYSWCGAFAFFCFDTCKIEAPRTGWAASFFTNEKTIYTRGQASPYRFKRSDVAGIYSDKSGRINHILFLDRQDGDYFITVEGNTSDKVASLRRHHRTLYKIARYE